MRRGLLLAALVFALAAGQAGAAPPTPTLKLVDLAPFTARGVHFSAYEHLRLVLTTGSQRFVRRVVAGRLGTFGVKFGDTTVDRCDGFVLVARGADGSRTVLKIKAECAPLSPP